MSKSVMLSIQPKWCELIASGKKTIEVRKTNPKIDVPFKCYIYCTKGSVGLYKNGDCITAEKISVIRVIPNLSGKVIGEFVCAGRMCCDALFAPHGLRQHCLTQDQLVAYSNCKELYGWRISDLKIYDKPRELREFKTLPCEKSENACGNCKHLEVINTPMAYEVNCYHEDGVSLTRPPQSWQYVEELK